MKLKVKFTISHSIVMYFSILSIICIHLLQRHRVGSTRSLQSQSERLSNIDFENVLEIFLADFKEGFLNGYDPRHVTVVGGSRDDLRQTRPLLDGYPFIICKDTARCGYSEEMSQGNFVIMFLEDLTNATVENTVEVLSSCRKCTVLFVSNGTIDLNDVWFVFNVAIEYNVPHFELVNLGENFIELYSDFVAANCSVEARLVSVWRPGTSLEEINSWAFRAPTMDGCPVSVSSLNFTPKMMIEETENGSLTIVGGREGKLVLMLAERLNFSVSLRYPSVTDQMKLSRQMSILNDVASGISEIGIGRLRPTNNNLNHTIIVSVPYDRECITWGVPRIINWSHDVVLVEFSWAVWLSIGLVFAITCIVAFTQRNFVSMNGQRMRPGFMTIFFDVVVIHLGNPVVNVSSSPGGRIVLTAVVFYSMVITTAYKTSLASILATEKGTATIVDAQGIIDANINVGGSLYDYKILEDQANESRLSSIMLERFVVNNNDTETWNRLMFDHDYAFLGRRSSMNYHRERIIKAHESVSFDVLSNCVSTYHTVIAFHNISFLREPSDRIILRLTESGIPRHWDLDKFDAEKVLEQKVLEKYYDQRAAHKFFNIMCVYFSCMALSAFVFVLELVVPRFYPRKRQRVLNRGGNVSLNVTCQ